jgi:predicted RNA polymerase sigma factor
LVATLDEVFREEWGRVLATLIGVLGDFDLAEDATQEAFAIAADRWSRVGAAPPHLAPRFAEVLSRGRGPIQQPLSERGG